MLRARTKKDERGEANPRDRYLNPPFIDVYKASCLAKAVEPDIVDSLEGVKGFWLGDSQAKNVIIFIHGGGFVMPGKVFHLIFLQSLLDSLTSAGRSIGIFFLTYTLSPHAIYPTQLRQAVEGVRYVLESHSPSDVILAGNSAGGNLAIGVLSHISHPHPAIKPLGLSEPLKGLMAMAPWCTFKSDWQSSKENSGKDCITARCLQNWSDAYLGPDIMSDYYIEAVTAPTSWWESAQVKDTLILAGSEEILRDGVLEWASRFGQGNPNTTVVVGPREGHDEPIFPTTVADGLETETGKALKEWVHARFGRDMPRSVI